MPLSKVRNRERMREFRLHKATSTPQGIKRVQPKPSDISVEHTDIDYIDADGNPVYDD